MDDFLADLAIAESATTAAPAPRTTTHLLPVSSSSLQIYE
jgi:hypothetical protein